MKETHTIAVVVPSLSQGGAERVATELSKHLSDQEYRVVLITVRSAAEDFFTLDPRVERIALELSRTSSMFLGAVPFNLRVAKAIRHAIRQSRVDIVLSLVDRTNIRVLLATWFMKVPVIVSERNDIGSRSIGRAWGALRSLMYRRAAAIVVQTDHAVAALQSVVPSLPKTVVIPNAVSSALQSSSELLMPPQELSRGSTLRVLAVGRLHEQKGFDLLIEAFAQLLLTFPNAELTILGEGAERSKLEALAKRLVPDGAVKLPGVVRDIGEYYTSADLFVLSSRYEGFPNVLLEAMAFGVPSIAFDCPAGPREILKDEENGLLVPAGRVDLLSRAMQRLAEKPDFAYRLGKNATYDISTRFSPHIVMKAWEKLIQEQIVRGETNATQTQRCDSRKGE